RSPPLSLLLPYTTLFRSATERGRHRPVIRDHERLPRDPASHRVVPPTVLCREAVLDGAEADEQLPEVVRRPLLHPDPAEDRTHTDRKCTRLNSSHVSISY